MIKLTWSEIEDITLSEWHSPLNLKIWGVPRGGCFIAMILASNNKAIMVETPEEADIIVDDLIDSGDTVARYREQYPHKPFFVPIDKRGDSRWIVFPWEAKEEPVKDNLERLNQYYNFSDKDFNTIKGIIEQYEK